MRPAPPDPSAWEIRHEPDRIVVSDGRKEYPFRRGSARAVRVVPLAAGPAHGIPQGGQGWQVAVSAFEGDVLMGPPLMDWRAARDFAQRLAETTELPLDEMTERLFSQTGLRDLPRDVHF